MRRGSPHSQASLSSSAWSPCVGKAWWDSRLPDTYSVMAYGTADYGGGPVPATTPGTKRRHTNVSVDRAPRARGPESPDARFDLTASERHDPPRVWAARSTALTFNGTSPGPRAPREARRPGRGHPPERGRRPGRDDPLARSRRAECRGRRRRRHPERGRCPARATPTASAPSRSARSGTTATRSPRARCGAGSSALFVIEPQAREPPTGWTSRSSLTRSTASRRSTRRTSSRDEPCGRARPFASG